MPDPDRENRALDEHARPVVVHLVHGTWPRGGFLPSKFPRLHALLAAKFPSQFPSSTPWFEEGSDFRRAVGSGIPGIQWDPFPWSGENREADRRAAAAKFASKLRNAISTARDACHVVVAHSHGGNVALWAIGQLDEHECSRVAGLATMGTPFLHFAPRRISEATIDYLQWLNSGALIRWSLVATPILCIAAVMTGELPWPTWDAYEWAGAVVLGCPVLYALFRTARPRAVNGKSAPEPQVALDRQPACPEHLASFIALRCRGDEAARVIAIADSGITALARFWPVVEWCARHLRLFDPVWRRATLRLALRLALLFWPAVVAFWWLAPDVRERLTALDPGVQVVSMLLVPVGLLLGFAALVLACAPMPLGLANLVLSYSKVLLGLAFGRDTATLAVTTEIVVDAGPPRPRVTLVQVDPGDSTTRHGLHAIPSARDLVATWIRERHAWAASRRSS